MSQVKLKGNKRTILRSESMKEKVYCDECKYLQNRKIEVNGEITGTRYYCSKRDRWYCIGSTFREVGLNFCTEGEKK